MSNLLLLFLIVNCHFSFAQSPSLRDGELLTYQVQYRAKLIPPIGLMRVTLRTILEPNYGGTGRPHYHVVAGGRTTGTAADIFPLNDTYHTWLDAKTLLPSRTTSDISEDRYRMKATYTYDWRSMTTSNVSRKASWDRDHFASLPLQKNSGDALALFSRLRTTDISKIEVGKPYPLDLVLNETHKPIRYTFHGRERIRVKRLGTRNALKFTCTMATSDGSVYEDGMTLTVWVSDDERRAPLLMECPVRVGRVTVTLVE